MDDIRNIISKSIIDEENTLKIIERSLKHSPGGHLRVMMCHGVPQYFLVTEKNDTKGKYIRKKDIEVAKKLAQRDYEKQMKKEILSRRKAFDKILKLLPTESLSFKYDSLPIGRRKLVMPYYMSDNEYAKSWEEVEYEGKQLAFDPPKYETKKGDMVRSKSEKIIADTLFDMKIPYRYEYPIRMKNGWIIYPDFMILDRRTRGEYLFEHFGMMDDEDYIEKTISKIRLYEENGFYVGDKLLFTIETSTAPLNLKSLEAILKKYTY